MTAHPMMAWHDACAVSTLVDQERIERLVAGTPLLLLWIEDAPVAVEALCPHASAPLIEGRVEAGRLHCARHQASFDLRTGAPDQGWSTVRALRVHAARIAGDRVEVRIAGG